MSYDSQSRSELNQLRTELDKVSARLTDVVSEVRAIPELIKEALLGLCVDMRMSLLGGAGRVGELPVTKDGVDVGFQVAIHSLAASIESRLDTMVLVDFDSVRELRKRVCALESEVGRTVEVAKRLQKD